MPEINTALRCPQCREFLFPDGAGSLLRAIVPARDNVRLDPLMDEAEFVCLRVDSECDMNEANFYCHNCDEDLPWTYQELREQVWPQEVEAATGRNLGEE